MKYIKTYENIKKVEKDKIYFFDGSIYNIVGKIYQITVKEGHPITGEPIDVNYYKIDGIIINEECEGERWSNILKDRWKRCREATEEEIEKYNLYTNANKYNM